MKKLDDGRRAAVAKLVACVAPYVAVTQCVACGRGYIKGKAHDCEMADCGRES